MMRFCPQCATPLEERPFEGKLRPTCPGCGHIVFVDPKVAASVLIERAGMLLLARRAIEPGRGRWCFPGGYVDFGEAPVTAAIRECREETGLAIGQVDLLDVSFNGRVIVITYVGHAPEGSLPVAADDADMVGWFAPDDLPPLAFENMYQAIELWQAKKIQRDRS